MGRSTTRIQNLTLITTLDNGDIVVIGPGSGDRAKGITFSNFKSLVTVGLFDNLTDGQVPKKDDLTGTLIYSGATVNPATLEWTFDESINVPAGSVKFGEVISISEGANRLFQQDFVLNTRSAFIFTDVDEILGSALPAYPAMGALFNSPEQPVFDTQLTANPLTFSFASVAPDDVRWTYRFNLKTFAAMTNFRVKVTDNASGVVIAYIPNKTDWDNNIGFSLILGDNVVDLVSTATSSPGVINLGGNPLEERNGQVIDYEMRADSISLLGTALGGGVPYNEPDVQDGDLVDLQTSAGVIFTEGSVPFANPDGHLTQDNPNLNFDDTTNTLNVENVNVNNLLTSTDAHNLYVENNYITLNSGYITTSSIAGGLVINRQPTAIVSTVVAGAFVSGVPATSNPTVATVEASIFSQNDIIQISVSSGNNGIYEVESHAANVLTVRGIGTVSTVLTFTNNQFVANASDNATITKVNYNVIQVGTDGVFETGAGAETDSFPFSDLLNGPGPAVALNSALAFDNTNGSSTTSIDQLLFTRAGTETEIELIAETAGSSQISFTQTLGVPGAFIDYSQSSGQSQYINTTGRMVFATTLSASDIVLSAGATASILLENPGSNTNAPVVIDVQGSGGTTVNFYASAVDPNGVITASQGDYCFVATGVDDTSAIWIKETGIGDTGWIEIISSSSAVSGPGPTVALNSAARFDDTGGLSISNLDQLLFRRLGTETEVELIAETGGSSQISFTQTAGVPGAFVEYSQSTGQLQYINTTGRMVFAATLATSDIVLEAGSTSSVILENPGGNTNAPVRFNAQGTGGAAVNFYTSTVDPNGVITAAQGDYCFVATGVDDTSAIWIKEVGIGNTGWVNILTASAGAVFGPATTNLTSIPTWDSTDGSSIQNNPLLTYSSTASASILSIRESTTGTADIFFNGTGGSGIGLIQSLGSNFQIEAIAAGGVLNLSGIGGVSLGSFSGDVTIENAVVFDSSGGDLEVRHFVPATNGIAAISVENSTNNEQIRLEYNESTDASTLDLNSSITLTQSTVATTLSLRANNVINVADIVLRDTGNVLRLQARIEENTTESIISSNGYDFFLTSTLQLVLQTNGSNYTRIDSTNGGNTVQILQLDNGGTSGATVDIYTSTVNPNGVITGSQGDFCFVATGVDNTSAIWIKEVGVGNTGWVNILSSSGGVSGPATTTLTSIPSWDSADGSSIQDNPLLTYASTASTSQLTLQEAATGSADFFFNGGGGAGIGLIQTIGSSFNFTSINSNDISVSSANDLTVSAPSGGVTVTSSGDTLRVQSTGTHAAIFEASGSGTVDLNANAGFISLINDHGEIVLGSTAIATVTGTGVNYDVTATSADILLTAGDQVVIDAPSLIELRATTGGGTVNIVGVGNDTLAISQFANSGTDGGTFDWYVGDSTPQGRISAGGALFFEDAISGTGDAKLYLHTDGAGATDWHAVVAMPAGATQAAGSMLFFPTTDLALADPTTLLLYDESTINTTLEMDAGAAGTSTFRLRNSSSAARFNAIYNEAINQVTLSTLSLANLNISSADDIDITAVGDCNVGTGNGTTTLSAFTRIDLVNGADADQALSNISNGGTQFNLFAYFGDPVSNVTGTPGDVLVRNDTTDSNVYIHAGGASNNADWRGLDAPAVLHWGDSSIASTTTTRYLTPGYDSGTAPTATVQYRVPRDGVLQNLYIYCRVAGGNGNNVVYTVRLNGINTALVVTLASNIQSGSNTTNRINAFQGDLIDIEITKAAGIGSTPVDVMASLELV